MTQPEAIKTKRTKSASREVLSPNKHMLRAGTHKVLGRGRSSAVLGQVPRARVLTGQRAGADVNRWATGRA